MDRKDLISKVDELRRDVTSLKSKLNEVSIKKENQFNTKEELKKQVSELISKIKILKKSKETFNLKIRVLKKERDDYNKKVKELASQIRKLNEEKKDLFKKQKIKIDPLKIKKQIEELE